MTVHNILILFYFALFPIDYISFQRVILFMIFYSTSRCIIFNKIWRKYTSRNFRVKCPYLCTSAFVIKSLLFIVTFESHFRSWGLDLCRSETSAGIVNRFLVATFIMHERCLPTGPDQDISSAFPRYCNGEVPLAIPIETFIAHQTAWAVEIS